ncbi:hypothetical protein HOY80DRAFT_1053823 [Tuber brumale]|nr:hypothetical protein HOY80DRAFT_1053823 [Tuber brumale]
MDIDEDSNDVPQCHRRLSKHPAELLSQQPRRVRSRLRFESPPPALNGLTPAFSSQSQDAQWHSSNLRVNLSNFSSSVLASGTILLVSFGRLLDIKDQATSHIVDPVTTLSDSSNFI